MVVLVYACKQAGRPGAITSRTGPRGEGGMNTQSPAVQSTRPRGGRAPETAILDQRPDGSIGALSSNGRDIYTVRLQPVLSCTCPGFSYRGACYHATAAVELYGSCEHCQAGGNVAVFTSPAGDRFVLCR